MSLLWRNASGPPEFSTPCEVKLVAKNENSFNEIWRSGHIFREAPTYSLERVRGAQHAGKRQNRSQEAVMDAYQGVFGSLAAVSSCVYALLTRCTVVPLNQPQRRAAVRRGAFCLKASNDDCRVTQIPPSSCTFQTIYMTNNVGVVL